MTATPSNRHAATPRTPANHTRVVPEGSGQENAAERHPRDRADWHAHEAHRLAGTQAGHTHALLAHYWHNRETR